jgi:hypothetical protein
MVQERSTLRVLEKWNAVLIELQSVSLSYEEQQAIESELDIHISTLKKDPSRATVKSTLSSFLSFLDHVLKIKSGNKLLAYGLVCGVLLGFVTGLGMGMGILIGFAAGAIGTLYVRRTYRTLNTNLEDLW